MRSGSTTKSTVAPPQGAVPLEDLLKEVKDALAVAQRMAQDKQLPPLDSVTLGLQTVAGLNAGGTVNLFVFKLGATTSTTETNRIVLTLTAPPASGPKEFASVQANLVNAMLAASEAVKAARGNLSGFEAKQVVCEYSFGVKVDGSGGLSLEILPISLGASVGASKQAVQTVTVSFKKP